MTGRRLRDAMILMTVRKPRATVLESSESALKLRPEAVEIIGPESIDRDQYDERRLTGWGGSGSGRGLGLRTSGSANQAEEYSRDWRHMAQSDRSAHPRQPMAGTSAGNNISAAFLESSLDGSSQTGFLR